MTEKEKKAEAKKLAATKKAQQEALAAGSKATADIATTQLDRAPVNNTPSANLEKRFENQSAPFAAPKNRQEIVANLATTQGNNKQRGLDKQSFADDLTNSGFSLSTASEEDKENLYARGASLGVSREKLDNFLSSDRTQSGGTQGGATQGGYAVTKSDPVMQGDVLGAPNRGRGGTNTYGSSGVQGASGLGGARGLSDEDRTMNAMHYKDPNKRSNDAARRDMMNNMSPNDIVPLNSPSRLAPSQFGTRGVSQVRGETNGPGGASGLTSGSERNMLFSQQARNNAKANKKQSRAYNLAYRQMLRQGDRVGALGILNDATDKGVSFGGVRQAGAFEQQAQDDLYRGSAGRREKDEKKRSRFF